MGQGSLFLCPIRKAGYGQATSPIMPIKFNKSMAQLNGNYLNGTNIAVLGTSAHETSEIMVYEHPLFGKVRMFIKNEKAWFCGMDIATSLQYSNTRDAIARHCKSQGVVIHDVIDSMGRTQQMKFISEGNIYRLTAKSQMPKADEFESWIFDDVVPSVINTGSYSLQPQLPNFNNPAESARAWADQYEKNQMLSLEVKKKEEEKQAIIEETKPAVVFTECVKSAPTNILVRDLAKLITQNGYKIGEIRLYDWMVENKYLICKKRWSKSQQKDVNDYMPTQRASEMGLFFVSERTITNCGNPTFIKHTCYVTGKGQVYFLNKFKALIGA
jgi:prophage antirepressor-like protein